MKKKILFMGIWWCTLCAPSALCAQSVVVTAGTVAVLKSSQTLPGLKNQGRVIVSDNTTLTLTGSILGSGRFAFANTASLVAAPSSTGVVYADPLQNTIKHLHVYGNLTLGNNLNITAGIYPGMVKIHGGTLHADSMLTLKSNADGTARIDSSRGDILGPVVVERYIPANRAWRFLTVPFVATTQSINQAWQEGYINTLLTCPSQYVGTTGYGTHITYNAINGYDRNITQNPSLQVFESASNKWNAPTSTLTTKSTQYSAYALFVRGDRTICLAQGVNAIPTPTTLRASGTVSIGSVMRSYTWIPNKYFLEGNPYASSIDLPSVLARSSGVVPETFWIWDPGYGANGGYVAYSHGVIAPMTTNYPTALRARIIQSGQAYMLQASSSAQVLSYQEYDKVSTQSSVVFGRPAAQSVMHVQLLSSEKKLLDGTAMRLVESSRDTAYTTMSKLWNFAGESVALKRRDYTYAIETRVIRDIDTFFVFLTNTKTAAYILELSQTNIASSRLIDGYLNREIVIGDSLQYRFFADIADSASYKNRFSIVYGLRDTIRQSSQYEIYPNPVKDVLYIRNISVSSSPQITITDVWGRVLIRTRATQIHCAFLSPGTYFLTIEGKTVLFQKQ